MEPAQGHLEFELKLAVPSDARMALRAAFLLPRTRPRMLRLQARYFDTPDRALARAGMALRVRREGRRWIQTLKTAGRGEVGRMEFDVPRPDGSIDLAALSGTPAAGPVGEALRSFDPALALRFETSIRRWVRRQRVRGGVVELSFDEGRILAGERALEVCELEIELLGGSPQAVFDVAARWQKRFGLVLDVRSKAERGDLLARGEETPVPTRATAVRLDKGLDACAAYVVCARSCVDQITRNASALALASGGDEHVHQLRVGIRRLRSLWRFFDGWVAPVPGDWVEQARVLFSALGADRDFAVLAGEVEPRILASGMPGPLIALAQRPAARAGEIVRASEVQAWLVELVRSVECPTPDGAPNECAATAATAETPVVHATDDNATPRADSTIRIKPLAAKRLRRWHARLVGDGTAFGRLDEMQRHDLRKRAKRLRYALEFSASLFEPRRARRYLARLAGLQDALGELNDLSLARSAYESYGDAPAAWYARGWIAARRAALEQEAEGALAALRECEVPWR